MKTPWSRLIRFVTTDDQIYFGDVVVEDDSAGFDVGAAAISKEPWPVRARVVEGNPLAEDCKVTDRIEVVKKLLGPLTKDTVSEIRCIGGNYAEHCMLDYPASLLLFLSPPCRISKWKQKSPFMMFQWLTDCFQ